MKKKRVAILMSINILALVVITMVMAVSAWAADSPSGMGTESAASTVKAQAGSGVTITLLNVSAFPPTDGFHNGIAAYYDHNEGIQTPFYGAGWVGIDICNNENVPQSVNVQLFDDDGTTPFPAFEEAFANRNAYMLGRGQNYSVTVPFIPAGQCRISYHYVFTPRFKTDDKNLPVPDRCEILFPNGDPGPCRQRVFYIDAVPEIGTVQTVSGTLVMDGVQTAHPGDIEKSVESTTIFTLTVYFESGNLCTTSGSCSGTYAPTTYFDHDAGVMHLIRISAVATDTNLIQHEAFDVMRLEGASTFELNQDPLKFVYVFVRDNSTNIDFYPSYAANSGATNYKGFADIAGIPTAITLIDLKTVSTQPQAILVVGIVLLLGAATLVVIRRQRQHE